MTPFAGVQRFISKVFGVWPDNTLWLKMMNRGLECIDTSHLCWRTQTYSSKKTAKSQQWGLMGGGDKVKRVSVTQYMQVCGWLFLPTLNSNTLFTMCQHRSPDFESSTRRQHCVEPGHLFLVLTCGLCMSLYLCTSAARVWLSQLLKVPHTCRVFTHWDTCFTH